MKKIYTFVMTMCTCALFVNAQSVIETKKNISEVKLQFENVAKEQTLPPTLSNFYVGNVPSGTYNEVHGNYVKTSDGGFAVSGYCNDQATPVLNGDGGYLMKLDASANVQWTYSVYPTGINKIWIESVFQASDGNYYLTGVYNNGSAVDNYMFIKKINSSGSLVWTRFYKESGTSDHDNPIVIESSGGNLYACYQQGFDVGFFEFNSGSGSIVAGQHGRTVCGCMGTLLRAKMTSTGKIGLLTGGRIVYFNPTGSVNMLHQVGGYDFLEAGGFIYFITTQTKALTKYYYYGTSIGSALWSKKYEYYPSDVYETFLGITLASDLNVIAHGRSQHTQTGSARLHHYMKIDASNGNVIWANCSGAMGEVIYNTDEMSPLITKSNGDYAVFVNTGYTTTTGYDVGLLEITSGGSYNGCYDNAFTPTVSVLTASTPATQSPVTLTVVPTSTLYAGVMTEGPGTITKYLGCNAASGSSPTAAFSMTNSGCINQAVSLSNSSTGNPSPTFVWSSNPSSGVSFAPSTTNANSVTFANTGTYTITLAATNTVGTNSTTHVITIATCTTGGGGGGNNCDSLKNITNPASIAIYFADTYAPNDSGYISGTNKYCDKGKYEKYTSGVAGQQLYGIRARIYKSSGSGSATFKVYNDAAGNPGSVIGSKTVLLNSMTSTQYAYITLTTPINVTTPYYIGFDVPGGGCSTLDTLVVFTNNFSTGGGTANMGYEQWSDNSWHTYNSTYAVTLNHYMFPIFCAPGTSIDQVMMNSELFTIYPNPGTGKYKIRNEYFNEFSIEVRDNLGKLVLVNDKLKNNEELDISGLSNGIYLVNIKTSGGVIVKKLFKN
jgi:hypothetical protein